MFVCKRMNTLTNEYPNIRYIRFTTTFFYYYACKNDQLCSKILSQIHDLTYANKHITIH